MPGELPTKLRLVRCPKCRLVLPEFPHYDVYKCGGCGTTLQAKRRKSETVISESSSNESKATPRNSSDLVSEDDECSKKEQLTFPQEDVERRKAANFSSGECSLDKNRIQAQNENGEQLETSNLSNEDLENKTDPNTYSDIETNQDEESNKGHSTDLIQCTIEANDANLQLAEGSNSGSSLSEGAREELNSAWNRENANHDESALPIAKPQVDIAGVDSTKSISAEKQSISRITSFTSEEDTTSDNHGLSLTEELKQAQYSINLSFEHVGSTDKSAAAEVINPSSELIDTVGELSNSPTTRSSHANDGSVSSYEGMDEQIPNYQHPNPSDNTRSVVDAVSEEISGERFRRVKDLVHSMLYGDTYSDIETNQDEESNKGHSTDLIQCTIEANDANLQLAEGSNSGSLLPEGAREELNSAWNRENANHDKSALPIAKPQVDIAGVDSTKSTSAEKQSISRITPFTSEEDTTSDNHGLPLTEELKQAQYSINLSFQRVGSTDKSAAAEVINPSSELSDIVGELSNSPTIRSSPAYDGSVSSYDGMDEQIPDYQHPNPLDNTRSAVDAVSEEISGERLRRVKDLVHSMLYGDTKARQHSMKILSDFPSGKHPIMNAADREEFTSKMHFHHSGSQSGYESGSPSNQLLDEVYSGPTSLPSDSCEDPDQEKMKLLKMIYELQDQLNRTIFLKGETNGRLSQSSSYKGKHISSYHTHEYIEETGRHRLDYPRHNGRCSHGINWCPRHKISLKPCSAEATSSALQVDLSCCHCYPQEWQYPAELPQHFIRQHEGLCRCHPGHSCYSSHDSHLANPQYFMGHSKPPLCGCETKSDDQRHQATHEVKKYLREKQNLAHVRPVAGGAPFVTCHHCFKLLQMPADFLLFKRVYHKLKCSSCSEVLKFSLVNRSHIVSYTPPNELNDQSKAVSGSNQPSESYINNFHSSQADPVSYSDDFGLSASKSLSSEGAISLTESHPPRGSEYDLSVSHGISEPTTEKEKIASRNSSSSETPVETIESAKLVSTMFVSEQASSQSEARPPPPPRNSPLHQLMGYTSPSQVVRGI